MRTIVQYAALVGFLPSLAVTLQAQDAALQTTPLTYTPLALPDATVSRPAAPDPADGSKPAKAAPRIAPKAATKNELQFRGQRTATLTIAGEEVSFAPSPDGSVSVRVGNRQQTLRPIPSGTIQSAHLILGENRRYMLAFPTRTGSGANMVLSYRTGAAQVGAIEGQSIWFYDHNTDGLYTIADDSYRIGDPTRVAVFAPISPYIATPSGIYEITQLNEDGSELQYTKHPGPTGQLDVEFAGGSAELSLVIASTDRQLTTVISASARARPPVTLIPGHYDLLAAIVTAPGRGQVVSTLDPASLPSIDIAAGQTTTLELGSPLALEFKADLRSGTQLGIDGKTLKLRGKSGETYTVIQWSNQPDISLVTAGIVKKLAKMNASHNGPCAVRYTAQIPALRGHARAKVVITGSIDGMGSVRGESPLE